MWKASELYRKLSSCLAIGFGFLHVILLILYINIKNSELELNLR
jgi:hypothetical protein